MASLLKWLDDAADFVGRGIDNVVPGNQGFLHRSAPQPPNTSVPANIPSGPLSSPSNFDVNKLRVDIPQKAKTLPSAPPSSAKLPGSKGVFLPWDIAAGVANKAFENPEMIPHIPETNNAALHGMADDIENPWLRLPAQAIAIAGDIGSGLVNLPYKEVKSGKDLVDEIHHKTLTPTKALGHIATAAEVPLALLAPGVSSVAETTAGKVLLDGLIGSGFGLAGGLENNTDAIDIQDQLIRAVPDTLIGLLAGTGAGLLGSVNVGKNGLSIGAGETGPVRTVQEDLVAKDLADAGRTEISAGSNKFGVPEIPFKEVASDSREPVTISNKGKVTEETLAKNTGLTVDQLRSNPIVEEALAETGKNISDLQKVTDSEVTAPESPKIPRTKQQLNVNRLNLDEAAKIDMLGRGETLPKTTLSDKEIVDVAKSAGLDTRSHTIEQTRTKIAEQLNVRQEAVRLLKEARNEANPTRQAALYAEVDRLSTIATEQGTDIARQLSARRIIANELMTPEQRVFTLLRKAGVNPEVYTKEAVGVDFSNASEVVRFYRSLVPATKGEWLDLVRYNSMLSSPLTQFVNISSTVGNIALAPIERGLSVMLDSLRPLFGKDRQFGPGEGRAYAKGMIGNVQEAVADFKRVVSGTNENMNIDTGTSGGRVPIQAPGDNVAVDVLDFPMKLMGAFDAFNKALVRGGSDAALKVRETAGVSVKNAENISTGEAAYRTFNQPLGDQSQGYLLRGIDEITNLVMKARASKNPLVKWPAKFTLPFVQIGTNLLKQGIEYGPAGVATLPGASNMTEQMAKAIMGTAVFGTAASLLGAGRLTWAEPTDEKQKAAFREAGMQPYSVKIGNNWVSFTKLPPIISFNFALVAALDDAQKNAKLNENGVDNVMTAISKYGNFLSDQSYLKNIGDTLAAIKGDKERFAQLVGNYPQQVIPFRALSGWIARMTDDTQRRINTDAGFASKQIENLFQQIPGLRQTTTPRVGPEGNPIAEQHPVFNAFSPVRVSTEQPYAKQTYDDMVAASKDRSLTRQQRELDKNNAQAPVLAGSDDLEKAQQRIDAVTKKFPSGLDDGSKKTLTHYARLSEEGKDNYNSSPRNVYDLAKAKYQQDKLAGRLSATEDFNRRRELAGRKVESKYSQEVVQMQDMSKSGLQAFLRNYPDKAALVNNVLKLDQDIADLKGTKSKFGGTIASKGRKGKGSKLAKLPVSTAGIHKLLSSAVIKPIKPKKTKLAKIKTRTKIA